VKTTRPVITLAFGNTKIVLVLRLLPSEHNVFDKH